jgi:hypothetical protein
MQAFIMYRNHREDKFLRATKYRHYRSDDKPATKAVSVKKTNETKPHKKLKALSFVFAITLAASALVIPTTTLAPAVDAFEDSKAASYSVGNLDEFSAVITDNCVPVTTAPATEIATTVESTTEETKQTEKATEATEETKATKAEESSSSKTSQSAAEASEAETSQAATDADSTKSEESTSYSESNSNSYVSSGSYLIDISNPDSSYNPQPVSLSSYDRAKLERLVMGEAGSMGYNGCALVAQAIRDAMNRSNTTSIDTIISDYQYYAPTNKEPTQTVKDAVSYIFDQNGSAVQHRILCFYTGTSEWHETQQFIVGCGSVRFFDFWSN